MPRVLGGAQGIFLGVPGDCPNKHFCLCLLMKSSEFKRWLSQRGATFEAGKGSHLRVKLNGKSSILPMHTADLKRGLVEGIKKQLGLK
jgi:mRNA interferase HicA